MPGSCPETWIYKKIPHAWGQGRSKGERGKKQMPQSGTENWVLKRIRIVCLPGRALRPPSMSGMHYMAEMAGFRNQN